MKKRKVKKLIRASITEAVEGIIDWLENETIVIDSDSGKEIKNHVITIKSNGEKDITKYVYPRLKKHGIEFIVDTTHNIEGVSFTEESI